MALIGLGKEKKFPRLQSRERSRRRDDEDDRRCPDGIPVEGHSQRMETEPKQAEQMTGGAWEAWKVRKAHSWKALGEKPIWNSTVWHNWVKLFRGMIIPIWLTLRGGNLPKVRNSLEPHAY